MNRLFVSLLVRLRERLEPAPAEQARKALCSSYSHLSWFLIYIIFLKMIPDSSVICMAQLIHRFNQRISRASLSAASSRMHCTVIPAPTNRNLLGWSWVKRQGHLTWVGKAPWLVTTCQIWATKSAAHGPQNETAFGHGFFRFLHNYLSG